LDVGLDVGEMLGILDVGEMLGIADSFTTPRTQN